MTGEAELRAAVEGAFVRTARGMRPWPDPHLDRRPRDDEYSRLTNPGRWRILGSRAEAWIEALVAAGLARVERDAAPTWRIRPRTEVTRLDRVVPAVTGGLPLVIGRTRIGDADDAGVTLGIGDPPVDVAAFPDCGCDACDSGSQDALDHLDEHIAAVVTGTFRFLNDGNRTILVLGRSRWSASSAGASPLRATDVARVLEDPTGWEEWSGPSWLAGNGRSTA